MDDNLPLLKDIHLPPAESYFLPGYGVGVIFLCLILAIVLFVALRTLYKKSRKRYALKLLRQCQTDSIESAARLSEVLRRICLVRYPSATALYGRAWIDFLKARTTALLDDGTANLLINAPYQPKTAKYTSADYKALRKFVTRWIGENL